MTAAASAADAWIAAASAADVTTAEGTAAEAPDGAGVGAAARIIATPDGRGGTALPLLAGDGPLALRRTRATGPEARVTVVGAMSAPLGGDRLAIEADVESGARLRVGSAAATISLPGRAPGPATYDVRLSVAAGAELNWLPEPLIAAAGSDLRMTTHVELDRGARLVLREEQLLGRFGEPAGRLTARLTVRLDGSPLLDQELAFGPGVPGWSGPAVLGGHRAVGQLLLAGPEFSTASRESQLPAVAEGEGELAVTPLAGPAVLVTAVAPDGLLLRRLLDRGLHAATALAAP